MIAQYHRKASILPAYLLDALPLSYSGYHHLSHQ